MDARLRARLRAGTASLRDMQRAGSSTGVMRWDVGKRAKLLKAYATLWYFYPSEVVTLVDAGWQEHLRRHVVDRQRRGYPWAQALETYAQSFQGSST